jgi:hypothetical protein
VKLPPEQRAAFAREVLELIDRFERDIHAACAKVGASGGAILQDIELADVRRLLRKEAAR